MNAVMTQIWIALCVYLLLAFLKFQSKLQKSTQQILQLLQLNLFEKRDLMALLRGDPPCDNQPDINQMVLKMRSDARSGSLSRPRCQDFLQFAVLRFGELFNWLILL